MDDSTIFEICNRNRIFVIQHSANITAHWSNDNAMRINTSKTNEMVIRFHKDRTYVESLPYIDINGTTIERVAQVKILSINISPHISWNAHKNEIVATARKTVYMIYQLKSTGFNQIDLARIDVSVIRPVVQYASPVCTRTCPNTYRTISR